ncbi:MAG: hypothetical protein K8H86_10735 [Ignavibacteriaceae bacterium]|nr:hypothetical protein [Ignavibacteriaceae bacterium]
MIKLFYFALYAYLFYFIIKLLRKLFTSKSKQTTAGNVNYNRRPKSKFENIEEAKFTVIDEDKKEDQK